MIESLISLLSIFLGVVAANMTGFILKKEKLTTSSSIAGVFGSILFIKIFSGLGFSPKHIVDLENIKYIALSINLVVSITGGCLAALLVYKFKRGKNNKSRENKFS